MRVFDKYFELLYSILTSYQEALVLAGIVFGIFICFYGYRLFKILLALSGFVPGSLAGLWLTGLVTDSGETALLIGGLAGGFIGAFFALFLFMAGVFMAGGAAGVLFLKIAEAAGGFDLHPLFLAIAGLAGGVLALFFQRLLISVFTTFAGSWLVVSGATSFFYDRINPLSLFGSREELSPRAAAYLGLLVFWIALGGAGLLAQYKLIGPESSDEDTAD